MSRHNMTSPISVLLAGVIVIILLLASSGANTSAITLQRSATSTWTPCNDDDNDCIDLQDNATATAQSLTETANDYPPEDTSAAYPPSGDTSVVTGTTTVTTTSGTGTAAARGTPTPIRGTPTVAGSPNAGATSSAPGDATQPEEGTATASPTPVDALTCAPGVPVEIAGDAPPRAPLLLYFAERPVGGGSVAPNGRFALKLIVGQERAGEYKVTVRVRGTSQVLRQVTCSVPNATPTPLASTPSR
jgi:hypothetical protein